MNKNKKLSQRKPGHPLQGERRRLRINVSLDPGTAERLRMLG